MNVKNKQTMSIHSWPEQDRPREKLIKNGEHTLTNSELLAILLRTGIKGQSAIDLARLILKKFKTFRNMSHTDLRDWKEFKGLGLAKITQIKAAIEIGRRFLTEKKEKKIKIESSKEVANLFLGRMRDLKKEVFKIVMLDAQNNIIDITEITEGTVSNVQPIIREIISKTLQNFASGLICIHNHPSGNPNPSKEDEDFTKELYQAAKIMQINVIDHIIIGNNNYYSFSDNNKLMS